MAALRISVPYQWLYDFLATDGVKLLSWEEGAPDQADLDETDLLVLPVHTLDKHPRFPYVTAALANEVIARSRARLVQLLSVGHEGLVSPSVPIANAEGVMEGPTAEHAVTLLLSSMRSLPDFAASQGNATWHNFTSPGLIGKSVALLGYGGVGSAIDQRLRNFDCHVTRFASRARTTADTVVHALSALDAGWLGTFDAVVLALPSTPATRKLVDPAFLAAMKENAVLVNVGRGVVVDTEALVEHAAKGHIRAAVDVVDPEPLPADHPLWSTPNITITPHVGGNTDAVAPALTDLILRQARRLQDGEPVLNRLEDSASDHWAG
ncbi:hypothetical protein FPZ12_021190 [Amycolatopsis acidicola]|uniref:D-isomer specific 2-hydroxyacid dehydrogenase NAD-binding domain-containing protein n=1 Tax=Amycolatopsis acidicola TaxID=2596893 RepID=A0A5N0V2Z3_9PSEU|nr:NAD(P)-dependent oxidoreductase [Amycolatopsis acidicola]KAA9159067.1 hypothetical protein FPZ12_021190 [Amycolatopsis acidicola]